jgi:tetratricopeptide (TPR) repeat protein
LMSTATQPKETTGVGAAAGGALGAGLGAIIGSQTGNAGSGLVVGALAGSASGALVGNAFQAQQESIRSQDEAIERQERMIRAQRSEVDELRRMNSDEVEKQQAALRNRGPNPTGYKPGAAALQTEPRARFGSASSGSALLERELTPPETVKEKPVPLPSIDREEAAPVARFTKPASAAPASCGEAEKEAQSASTSSEQSDKLFHLRRALRLCPENASFHHELGKVYLGLNRKADAEYEFKQALAADPTFRPAKTSLEALNRKNGERF